MQDLSSYPSFLETDWPVPWIAQGVFDGLVTEAIAAYDRIVGLDLTETAVDGSQHKAPCGGRGTGKTPLTGGNWAGNGLF